jgi:hypothetical protein
MLVVVVVVVVVVSLVRCLQICFILCLKFFSFGSVLFFGRFYMVVLLLVLLDKIVPTVLSHQHSNPLESSSPWVGCHTQTFYTWWVYVDLVR